MRVLVIGGTRFVGPHVIKQLSEMGHQVAAFHRGGTGADLPEDVRHILGDRNRLTDSAGEFTRFDPRIVLDMIPSTEEHAKSVMSTFEGIAQRIVVISSQDVYRAYGRLIGIEPGPTEPVPLSEDAPLRRKLYPYRGQTRGPEDSLYHYEKILVEQAVMDNPQLPGTVLRLPMVYGPGDPFHRVFEHLKRMDDCRPAILLDEGMARWRWTRGYVENVAAAIALAVMDERATGRIYNVGEAETSSIADWITAIGRQAGWDGRVVTVPGDRLPAHLTPDINTSQHLVADTSRIREELDHREPVSRGEAIRRTVSWERAHPPDEIDPQQFDYAAEDTALARLGEHCD